MAPLEELNSTNLRASKHNIKLQASFHLIVNFL